MMANVDEHLSQRPTPMALGDEAREDGCRAALLAGLFLLDDAHSNVKRAILRRSAILQNPMEKEERVVAVELFRMPKPT